MNCEGFYEAELIDDSTGEVVQYWKSKNTVNYGFVGGLFKRVFGVGAENTGLTTTNPSRTPYADKAHFGQLNLFKTGQSTGYTGVIVPSEVDTIATYQTDASAQKDITQSNVITYSAVTMTTSGENKITLTLQVTFGPTEGLYNNTSPTQWLSMGISSTTITELSDKRLLTRVLMGTGISKTNQQTLRVRYNFSIVVQ